MNKLYANGLTAALLLVGLSAAHAQGQRPADGPGYDLGTRQELVQQLETQVAAGLAQRTAPTVTLRVAASQAFSGRVNYREDLTKTGEYVVGDLAGVPGASFQLRIVGETVEGNIILRASRQAYRYSADARGHVLVRAVDINKVVCIDYNKPVGYREVAPAAGAANRAAVVSLQSYPGARGCILLDTDGYALPAGTGWNNGNAYNAPSASMTDANVQAMWELVSEDFRPFSLNVTTDENVFNAYPKNMRMRCVISPGSGSTIANGAGGVAFLTSFKTNDDTPCWVFMSDPKSGGEAASHEVGHTLGLSHDGRISPSEGYYTGQDNSGAWAPIMGAGYYKPVTHWSRGEYNSANNQEDDLAIMSGTTYNVGYRPDDHSNAISGATNLARNGNGLSANGIIERTADQDYFAFSTAGGTVSFNVNTVGRYGDLDIVARLFNSGGGLIGTYDTQGGGNLNVSFSASLGAGTYYLQIDGTSSGNPATDGYSDYGSLGTFSISGSAPAPSGGVATMYRDCNYTGTAVALPVGDYNLAALQARGILNDDVSSLTVNGGYQVVLYENDNFSGGALTVTASNSCLVNNPLGTGNWNDKTTSLRVQTATASFSRQLEAELANVNNGMTVEACSDAGGGQDMGYIDAGDYLVWNGINFPTTGTYLIEYRVASGASGGTISADLNAGSIQFGNTAIPATGGWQNWTTVSKTVTINAGTYNFGIYAQTGGYNLNWVRITKQGANRMASANAEILASSSPKQLELYPNPVADKLYIHTETVATDAQYRILNTYGKAVGSGALSTGPVDVAALPTGVYTLVVSVPGQPTVTRRFVK
ncbi:carbohydrate-binding protein [Hymenobacter sp. DH14]|uniref:Carbohydrate-binding protein n=1 Tax=Hymenobacter cyanobacteriorum TaxID=2926463 RepID=A0A9X1VER1_9BACT|nr:carbohydrate-binding protein [Hymenobacter cyanobacteriorum]MCI1186753.1 carbohydrate-binding protein [Hymenobacter cyanobacteriorum]